MKVVEGKFGDQEKVTLGETLRLALEEAELTDKHGLLVTLVDTEDRMTFITNEASKAEVLLLLEQAKAAILGSL